MEELAGHIVTRTGVMPGRVTFGKTILSVEPNPAAPDRYVLPGFIDVHVHGGGGADTMDGPAGVRAMARFHLRHGATTLFPTTITRPWPEVMDALRGVAEVCREGAPGGPDIPGAHLEGPFISPHRLGAQPPFAILPEPGRIAEALATGAVRLATLAPELPGAAAAMADFARAGVRVSLGHSAASFDCAAAALDTVRAAGGIGGGTHLFNAMGGIEGRSPGLAGALLTSDFAYAELILDLQHVHPGAFGLARRVMGDRLILITDAIRAAGLADGESELGGQRVLVRNGAARLADGSLAGSVLTMDVALRNAVASGARLEEAVALLSANPARYLGLHDRGSIVPGLRADLLVLDETLRVQQVWVAGARLV